MMSLMMCWIGVECALPWISVLVRGPSVGLWIQAVVGLGSWMYITRKALCMAWHGVGQANALHWRWDMHHKNIDPDQNLRTYNVCKQSYAESRVLNGPVQKMDAVLAGPQVSHDSFCHCGSRCGDRLFVSVCTNLVCWHSMARNIRQLFRPNPPLLRAGLSKVT